MFETLFSRPDAIARHHNGPLAVERTAYLITGCKFSVVQVLRSSAQIEGNRIRRERCAKRNAWESEPAKDTDMRMIAMFSGPCAADALTARASDFSHKFNRLE